MTERFLINRDTDATGLVWLLSQQHDFVVVDIESNGLRPYHGDKIIGLALYFPSVDESYYVSVRHPENNVSEALWHLVLDARPRAAKVQVGFNYKFDLHFLMLEGLKEPELIEDVIIAAHLLNENEDLSNGGKDGAYKLKRLAAKYLGAKAAGDEKELTRIAKSRGLNPKSEMWKLEAEVVAPYAMGDVEITWQLRQFYMPHLEAWRQVEFYQRRNLFVLKALLRMERNGMRVNLETIRQHQAEIQPQMEAISQQFQDEMTRMGVKLTDKKDVRGINLNSHPQVKTFFELHGRKLDSTDKLTLQGLQIAGDRWAGLLLEYRVLHRANQTYYNKYLDMVDADGFIHPNLNPTGTVTGRLSSDMQQIPRGSEKYKVKQVFEPRPGYALFSFDYSQLELRLATHYAVEETMRGMFNDGVDMHQYTANALGVSRHQGKTANFSFLYGMGAYMGSLRLGTDQETAKGIIDGWHRLYPGFKRALYTWQDVAQEWRDKDGNPGGKYQYVRLFNGRVRHFHEYLKYPRYDEDGNEMPPPYRDAWNAYIQGTGAGITEESILQVCLAFPDNDVFKPLLTIHDSFMPEIRLDMVNEIAPEVKRIMTDYPQFNPALGVDAEVTTTTWWNMHKYKKPVWERWMRRFGNSVLEAV